MLVCARWLIPITSPPLRDGAVLVCEGRLEAVGAAATLRSAHPDEPVRDLGQAALLPGLVNAHSHLDISLLRWALQGLPLAEWIARLVELRRNVLTALDDEVSAALGSAEMLRGGVTCLGDSGWSGAARSAMRGAGLRGVAFQEVFALAEDQTQAGLMAARRRLEEAAGEDESLVRTGLSPHAPYTSAPGLLSGIAALAAEHDRPLTIHLAESEAERAFLRDGSGPFGENRRSRGLPVEPSRLSPVEHLARAGWLELEVPVQLVHLTTASELELDILAERARHPHAPVVTACPRSNLRLGNGAPDLAGWVRRGLPWSLGTDGAASTGACDLFEEGRLAARLLELGGRPSSPRELLRRLCLDGARALGLEDQVGSLEPGKRADLCGVSMRGPRFEPEGDPEAAVLECAGPGDVVFVAVEGETLVEEGRLTRLDEERLIARARERAARLR